MGKKAPPLTDQDKQEIIERFLAGEGLVALGRSYGRIYQSIKAVLVEADVEWRRTATANTPIEQRLHDALMTAGIGFRTQARVVGRYIVDVLIHQAPVVIEADGFRHRVGNGQSRDAVRDAAHEAAGYRVFRFTGSELNTDAVKCVQAVIDACGLVPDQEPVYDIRTSFRGPDNPAWQGGPDRLREFTCEYCGEMFPSRERRRFCSREHRGLALIESGKLKGGSKSAEHRAKIGEANRRRVVTDETRAKMSAYRTGKPTTKGQPKSAEHRAKLSAANTGHRDSDETRAKKSASRRGKTMDEATRAKISAALKGKSKSPEHRANLSASRQRSNQIMIESEPA
jgi:very-short-patch-repair endonuclease